MNEKQIGSFEENPPGIWVGTSIKTLRMNSQLSFEKDKYIIS